MKKLARTVLNRLGYEIHKKRDARLFGYEIRKKHDMNLLGNYHAAYLAQICRPKTVIDVGVGYGTFPLYEAFPEARFILVEPLREYEDAIEKIAQKYRCEIFFKAVGDAPGTQEISVDPSHLEMSSFAERTPLTRKGNQLEKRVVEVTTLDSIFEEALPLQGPILLKIDTEGHELKALQGAPSLLRATDIVIAEVSIAKRFELSYEFEDFIMFMKTSGYYLLGFLDITHLDGELRPRYADIVFKRRPEGS